MNYQEFKNAVLSAAKENGLKDYELYYTESSGTSVEAYRAKLTPSHPKALSEYALNAL